MKKTFLFIAIVVSVTTQAQVSSVSLQASGLTCSMCGNAINKALKTLDFVQKIEADIKTYTFEISFRPNSDIDFDMIRKKVESAGFAVCSFVANINFDNTHVLNNQTIQFQDKTLFLVNTKVQILSGENKVRILDKGFVSPKEYKMNPFSVASPKTYHVSL